MRGLLDVSFFVALAWPTHQFHATARQWFEKNEHLGWVTCAITQLGFVRLSSQSSVFGADAKTPDEARHLLKELISRRHHTYVSELPSVTDCAELARILGPNKVTDAYLVGLARINKCRFVTFDQRLTSLASGANLIEMVRPAVSGS
jgi:toxin-antitoxin system PIN domain toxin